MQPASALAGRKKPVIQAAKPQPKVSLAQSKDIMAGLIGELDEQEELEEIGAPLGANRRHTLQEENHHMAFN